MRCAKKCLRSAKDVHTRAHASNKMPIIVSHTMVYASHSHLRHVLVTRIVCVTITLISKPIVLLACEGVSRPLEH